MIIARVLVWEVDLVLFDDLFAVLSDMALAKSECGREETAGTESGSGRKAFGE
jgi:hypothetical protein